MKLKKITLHNIRSYTDVEIEFPENTTLLSGNIGSGKSTILLAIDFVLFGLQRGNLSGASLLRNGTDEGFVELTFTLDKDIILCRKLKRSKTSVGQDAGYIIRNGEKEEKTAIELRQIVLELLHYPSDILTKSKSLIYRYTVYTPQEEMKQILLGNKEDRLETLRKVFGIDKYKRIKNNSKVVVSDLKSKCKGLQGMAFDLDEKKVKVLQLQEELVTTQNKLLDLEPKIESAKRVVEKCKQDISVVEEKIEQMQLVKKELHGLDVEQEQKMNLLKRKREELEQLEQSLLILRQEDLILPSDEINIEDKKIQIQALETKQIEFRNKIQELKTLQNSSNQVIEKINRLDNCPMCLQEVTHVHKQSIIEKEGEKLRDYEENINEQEELLKQKELLLQELKTETEILQKKQQQIELIKLKQKSLAEKEALFLATNEETNKLKIELGELNQKKTELFTKQEQFKSIEEIYPELKKSLEDSQENYRKVELEKVAIESQMKPIENNIQTIKEEIEKKEQAKIKAEYFSQLHFWISEHFIPMMDTMEKNIMLKVHQDFNSLFTKWFSMLIDNDILKMELDEEFSPKIEQNGYDIEYEYLSGGEKTAAALAYRLSLNQVINNLMSEIRTKDLLILDEPTDGFSSSQLDKMRDVLEELKINQVILVSHEEKIQSFVDNVIKLEKEDHVSCVN